MLNTYKTRRFHMMCVHTHTILKDPSLIFGTKPTRTDVFLCEKQTIIEQANTTLIFNVSRTQPQCTSEYARTRDSCVCKFQKRPASLEK